MKKKALSLLLALTMCLSMLPAVALADNEPAKTATTKTVGIYLRTLDKIQTNQPGEANFVNVPAEQLQAMGLVDYYDSDNYGHWIAYGSFESATAASCSGTQNRDSEKVKAVVNELQSATITKNANISLNLPTATGALTWDTLSWSQNSSSANSWHLNGELHFYKAKFDLNYTGADDSNAALTRYEVVGTDINSGLPSTPTRENYIFDGWYTEQTGGTKVEEIPKLTDDVTYYAHWTAGTEHTHDNIAFTAWNETTSLPTETGNYYLTNDVTITTTWEPADGVNLCLNGKTITKNDRYDVIQVTKKKTFNLYDEAANEGKITHGVDAQGQKYTGRGVHVCGDQRAANNTFNMYGGNITGNIVAADGAGVLVEGAQNTFNMHGGSITDNEAMYSSLGDNTGNGGGVHVANNACKFNMRGGTISGNTANYCGGGVNNNGLLKMYGGNITGNYGRVGGGIHLYHDMTVSGTVDIVGNYTLNETDYSKTNNPNNVFCSSSVLELSNLNTNTRIGITKELNGGNTDLVFATGASAGVLQCFSSDNPAYHISLQETDLHISRDTIAPATLTANDFNFTAPSDLMYDGNAKVAAVTPNKTGIGDITVKYYKDGNRVAADDVKDAGAYTIKIDVAEGQNYNAANDLTANVWTFTITPAVLTVTPNALSKTVGAADPELTYTVSGAQNGETPAFTGALSRAPGDTAGTYAINQGALALKDNGTFKASNYTLHLTTVNFTINNRTSSGGGHSSGSSTPKYTVSVPSGTTGGTVKSNVSSAAKGSTVTVTVTPQDGYKLDKLIVADEKGNTITATDKGDNKYTFTMPSSKVTVTPSFSKIEETKPETSPFDDVIANDYFYDAVKWAADKDITGGVSSSLFAPEDGCTRAQIVTFLWRTAGSPEPSALSSFNDVPSDKYYAKAVAWAVENGITVGTTAATFSPDDICTRAHGVTFLYRAAKATASVGASAFTDVADSAYYADAVKWATEQGITKGISSTLFGPDETCTRAQIVTFLYRLYGSK